MCGLARKKTEIVHTDLPAVPLPGPGVRYPACDKSDSVRARDGSPQKRLPEQADVFYMGNIALQ